MAVVASAACGVDVFVFEMVVPLAERVIEPEQPGISNAHLIQLQGARSIGPDAFLSAAVLTLSTAAAVPSFDFSRPSSQPVDVKLPLKAYVRIVAYRRDFGFAS